MTSSTRCGREPTWQRKGSVVKQSTVRARQLQSAMAFSALFARASGASETVPSKDVDD